MFVNVPKLTHVEVATLNNRVDVRVKVDIGVKNYTKISGGWCGRDLVTKDIYWERRMLSFCDDTGNATMVRKQCQIKCFFVYIPARTVARPDDWNSIHYPS